MKILTKEETLLTNQDFEKLFHSLDPPSNTIEKTLRHNLNGFFSSSTSKINYESFKALAKFDFSQVELLNLANQPPGSIIELLPLVEECNVRFTEAQMEEILNIIRNSSE